MDASHFFLLERKTKRRSEVEYCSSRSWLKIFVRADQTTDKYPLQLVNLLQSGVKSRERNTHKHTHRFLQVKLVVGQVLLLLCQVTVSHFVFKHGHVVASLLCQCCILIGHLKMSAGNEKGLLFPEAAQRCSW